MSILNTSIRLTIHIKVHTPLYGFESPNAATMANKSFTSIYFPYYFIFHTKVITTTPIDKKKKAEAVSLKDSTSAINTV